MLAGASTILTGAPAVTSSEDLPRLHGGSFRRGGAAPDAIRGR